MDEAKKMRLFVAGQASENPDDWNPWFQTKYVIAETKDDAAKLIDFTNQIVEVSMERPAPVVLM